MVVTLVNLMRIHPQTGHEDHIENNLVSSFFGKYNAIKNLTLKLEVRKEI